MKPHRTLRNMLVHPKDKIKQEDKTGVVYQIPCKNCERVYIGETARSLGERVSEHKKDVMSNTKKNYTRATRKESQGEYNKSAITDHCNKYNHIVDWDNIKVLEMEDNTTARRIREAIHIKKTHDHNMNRDEGAVTLSPTYQFLLLRNGTSSSVKA